jgi:hypothetical protein
MGLSQTSITFAGGKRCTVTSTGSATSATVTFKQLHLAGLENNPGLLGLLRWCVAGLKLCVPTPVTMAGLGCGAMV